VSQPSSNGPAKGQRRRVQRNRFWWGLSKTIVSWFSRLYFRVRFEGGEHMPASGPLLIVSNHASYLDPPMVGISAPRWVAFLAQVGLAKFAPMRWWMAQVGVTLVDRDAPSKETMRLVADSLQAGEAVGIFPEGTRSRDGSLGPFRSGLEFLVRRTRAVVLPVGIDGAFRAFPRGALLPRPRKIVVRYGEPWSAERVLAEGGIDALRARIAELARVPLREATAVDRSSLTSSSSPAVASADATAGPSSAAGGGA
jgi:1-acyl-sn-glycerol-3-phosphate acyltransferase